MTGLQAYDAVAKGIPVVIALSAIVGSWFVAKYQIKRADDDIKSLTDKIEKEIDAVKKKTMLDIKPLAAKMDEILSECRAEREKFASKEMVLLVERNVQLKISEKVNTIHDQLQYLIVEVRELRSDYKEILRNRK